MKGLWRKQLESRITPFREYDPLGVRPIVVIVLSAVMFIVTVIVVLAISDPWWIIVTNSHPHPERHYHLIISAVMDNTLPSQHHTCRYLGVQSRLIT